MNKKIVACVLMVSVLSSGLYGCGQNKINTGGQGKVIEWSTVKDSSELPDWTGKQIKLAYWDAEGSASLKRNKLAQNDVVTPEIFRVTGVMYDPEKSIDNGGQGNMEAKLGKLSAVNEYPSVVERADRMIMKKLAKADLIYDLTELIPKYCPNLMKAISKDKYDDVWNDQIVSQDGKIYGMPVHFKQQNLERVIDKNSMSDQNALVQFGIAPKPSRGSVYIRDDILKMIYPQAKTQKELEDVFIKRGGKFLPEDYEDVKISDVDEFYTLLRKIKELGLKENGREIYPIYTHTGGDNWDLMAALNGMLYGYPSSTQNNYFTYFDKQTQKLEFTFKQPWLKDIMFKWNQLIREGVVPMESLIENVSLFNEKINNGQYAIIGVEWRRPSDAMLEKNGKTYKYRKLVLDIPPDYNRFVFSYDLPMTGGGRSALIFKSSVKEEDLPQVLRFYDFMYSEAGRKLAVWGPKSAGLFTEENGARKFVHQELEDCIVNGMKNDSDVKYGLMNTSWPGYPYNWANPYHPVLTKKGSITLKPSMLNMFYNYGFIEPLNQVKSYDWYINNFTAEVPDVKKFWESRPAFETAMKRVFTANSEAEFEKLYSEFVNSAVASGATDKTLQEMNDKFKELNKDNMQNLK